MARAIDWEAEGLLEGLDGPARDARRQLLDELHAGGVELDELRAAVDEDRLVLLPIERALTDSPPRYTEGEVAERVGLDLEYLRALWRAMGMAQPDRDVRCFTDDDVEAARQIKQVLDAGMPREGVLEISRVMGQSMAGLASGVGGVFSEAFMKPGDTEVELGQRFAEATRALRPVLSSLNDYVLDVHQRQLLRQNMVREAELAAGRLEGAREVAVCFADLVGFTRLGERVGPAEIGAVAGSLTEIAAEAAGAPVRLVKMIGDAAMLVSYEVDPLIDATLSMIEAADAKGEDFPQLRAGIAAGEALGRAGDWYGRPVNLASRLTAYARPGSALATKDVRESAGDSYQWSFAGRRRFKGIRGDVTLFRVRADEE